MSAEQVGSGMLKPVAEDKKVGPVPKEVKLKVPRTVDKAWFRARLEKLGLNQSDLSKLMGLGRSVVSKMISGDNAVSTERLALVSSILKVSTDELAKRLGADVADTTTGKIAVVGRVIDGNVKRMKDGFAPMCTGADNDTLAIRNYTHGPLYGSIYYFQDAQGIAIDAIGRQCLVKTKAGTEMIRIVENGIRPGLFDLIDFDGSRQAGVQLDSATRIKWTMGSL